MSGRVGIIAGQTQLPILVARGMRWSAGGGYSLALVASLLLVIAARIESTPLVLCALVAFGLGLGPAASTSLVAPQNHVAFEHRGIVTSAVYAARMLGGSLTIGALGALAAEGKQVALAFPSMAVLSGTALVLSLVVIPPKETES